MTWSPFSDQSGGDVFFDGKDGMLAVHADATLEEAKAVFVRPGAGDEEGAEGVHFAF